MWAKISNSATSMACAACIAVAATLPWAGSAAERLATEDMRLAAITDVAAFSAVPFYIDILSGDFGTGAAGLSSINGIPPLLAFLNGDINALTPTASSPGYAALSALPVFAAIANAGSLNDAITALGGYAALSAIPVFRNVLTAGNLNDAITALGGYAALSAVPVFRDVAVAAAAGRFTGPNSVASALGGYAALSAVDTFFGDGPNGRGGVFTGGGVNALAPAADGSGGYAALSALPVFFGTDPNAPFGLGVFTGGGIGALKNYAALSAIPAYLNIPQNAVAPMAATNAAPQTQANLVPDPAPTTTTTSTGSNPVKTFVAALPKPKDFTPPAPQAITPPAPQQDQPKAGLSADDITNKQNVTRPSDNFSTTNRVGDNPFLFGSGKKGPDSGIRGWDKVVGALNPGSGASADASTG